MRLFQSNIRRPGSKMPQLRILVMTGLVTSSMILLSFLVNCTLVFIANVTCHTQLWAKAERYCGLVTTPSDWDSVDCEHTAKWCFSQRSPSKRLRLLSAGRGTPWAASRQLHQPLQAHREGTDRSGWGCSLA